jgi:predicted transglutaminase-like cysteine proteinase
MSTAVGARAIARGAIILLSFCLVAGEASGKTRQRRHAAGRAPVTALVEAPRALAPTPTPIRFFTINHVLAKRAGLADAAAPVRLASLDPGAPVGDAVPPAAPTSSAEPFGLFTFRAPQGALWAKWRGVEADLVVEAETVGLCGIDPARCPSPAALKFIALVDAARAQDGRARIEFVNRAVNLAVRYMSDYAQHGVADLWSAPLATLTTGFGDCEDYAIAKLAVLRAAGVPAENLRILLVRDTAVHADHAVLAVREESRWLILDNRTMLLSEDRDSANLMPLIAIDSQGVKLLAAPYARALPTEDVAPAAQWGEAADAASAVTAGGSPSELPLLM